MIDLDKIITRLNRIEGQVRGIQKMIKEEKDYKSIIQQVSAVKSALNKVAMLYISNALGKYLNTEEQVSQETLEKIHDVIISSSKLI